MKLPHLLEHKLKLKNTCVLQPIGLDLFDVVYTPVEFLGFCQNPLSPKYASLVTLWGRSMLRRVLTGSMVVQIDGTVTQRDGAALEVERLNIRWVKTVAL